MYKVSRFVLFLFVVGCLLLLTHSFAWMMSQLLDMLKFYTGFEINDQTGNALTENEMTTIHYDRITSLQVGRWQKCLWERKDLDLLFHS